jgi:glycosyltransferase involved in cell wall biosynthesis
MKILHLIYDHINNPWVGGGGALRAYEIYRRLAEKHEITIVCGKYPRCEDYSEGSLRFRFTGTEKNNYILSTFCYALRAGRFLRENQSHFDIIVEDFSPYNPIFSFLWKKDAVLQLHQKEGWHHIRKYPLFGICFGLIELLYPRLFKNLIKATITNGEKFSTKKNVAILPNGYDQKLLTSQPIDGDYVLYLGRFHVDQKGLDTLSRALNDVEIKLIMAGKGKDESEVQKLFKRHIEQGIVKIVGFIEGDKKTDFLRKCQFLVVPSRYEGQSIVCLEAAACGKPVVVSDIPEMKYILEAGFGISFKTGDPKDLWGKMSFLLENESLRKEMGRKAREFAKNLTWARVAEEYEKFLICVRS